MAGLTEKQFQQQIIQLAHLHGWWCYHTHDSRRSQPGFPDLVLIRGRSILYRELKTDRGRLTIDQQHVLDLLHIAKADQGVWRPRDWPAIESTLSAPIDLPAIE